MLERFAFLLLWNSIPIQEKILVLRRVAKTAVKKGRRSSRNHSLFNDEANWQ
jgi:hypothetical protein